MELNVGWVLVQVVSIALFVGLIAVVVWAFRRGRGTSARREAEALAGRVARLEEAADSAQSRTTANSSDTPP